MEHGVPDDLVQIIRRGERPGLDEITVATTRVPVFGTYMQDPINGYRPLGRLSSIEVQLQPPSTAIQFHRELLAVVESGLAVAANFPDAWAPSSLTIKSHFIVIFDWVSSFPKSPLSVRPVRRISITDWLRGLEDASTDSHQENSPVSEIDAAFQSSSNSPVPVTGQAASSRDMPVLEPGTSIETICHRCQITDDQIRSARFQAAAKSLLRTVLNYKSMSHILLRLGLQERDAPFVPLQTVTLPGDLVVSAGEVVEHFGWTMESFKRKTVWYGWAEQAASSQEWNEPTPSELFHFTILVCLAYFAISTLSRTADGHSNYSAYRVWLAITYFWGPQGPVILGRFRDDAVVRDDGKDALSLKQSQIHQFQAIITRHI
jgi:hypothetical protein